MTRISIVLLALWPVIGHAQDAPADAPPEVRPPEAPLSAPASPEPPPPDLPPRPPPPPPPPPSPEVARLERPRFERIAPTPSNRRHAFHLGMALGLQVAEDGAATFAIGAGAHIGWEIYWPRIAFELAFAAQAHGDQTTTPDHGFWEVHPMAYLKVPFRGGVWELFGGYGGSPPSLHRGDFAIDTYYHVLELGLEDRTKHWYSRLFVRWYAPFDGDLRSAPTVLVCATVGLFHLSRPPTAR